VSIQRLCELGLALTFFACMDRSLERDSEAMVVLQESAISWVRNFNPLIPHGSRWPTQHGIYEPMMVYNPMASAWVPWLATDHTWSADATQLEVSLRSAVQWSDGADFSADDVVFTFEFLKTHAGLDTVGLWSERLESVEKLGSHSVRFTFEAPFVPGFDIVMGVPIIPVHVWSEVADPLTFGNPDPVGTGPFTEVIRFTSQRFELGRNPHYWQEGKPAVSVLRFPAVGGNEQGAWALSRGEVDWAGSFLPAIDKVFVDKDPEHHHYWHPLVGASVFLFPNTTRPPLDDPSVRKAISMAIDRDFIVQVAMQGHVKPADVTGLSPAYDRWKSSEVLGSADWTRHDPEAAGALLDDAGYPKDANGRRGLELEMLVVSGWTDWVRALQVIDQSLDSIGIDTTVRMLDFGAWSDRRTRGDFDLSMGWSNIGATPHGYYRDLMSTEKLKPTGEAIHTNWHRFGLSATDTAAAREADFHIEALARETEFENQVSHVHALQAIMAQSAPALPLFYNPSWGEYNTRYFTGFPTPEDPYAPLSPNSGAASLLVMTQVAPR
jgi:peptide/nickel transport system substrate-binding protein